MAGTKQQNEVEVPTTGSGIFALVKRAQAGDKSTVPALKKLLEKPEHVDLMGGNVAAEAQRSFINAMAGKNLAFKESLTRKLELLRSELAGLNPTPVERLLIERLVATWLQVQDADIRYAQAENLSKHWGDYFISRMDRANKRYLAALKTLAQVRRLAVPVLQFNIARKQLNIAGGSVVSDDI